MLTLSLTSFIVLDFSELPELIKSKLEKYITEDAPEKIYIHTDKPYYSLGEDIWFTGYLVDGVTHTKNPKSFMFYVELINEKDSIVSKRRMFTVDVTMPGDFKIDEEWNPGTYKLRAYTNYMRNDDPDYFYQKKIAVISTKTDGTNTSNLNTALEAGDTSTFKLIKPDLNFYPEGGDLVENIQSEVGIKVKNVLFNDVKINGTINDENNELVSQFSISKYGVSKFSFTPQSNKTYTANIELNGSEYNYPLPKALPNGHALSIVNKGNYLYVTVKSNAVSGLNQTYLLGHQRGKIVVEKFETTNTNEYVLKLLTDELNDGIMHFTLFNAEGNPVCERLVFIENLKNEATVEIKKDKELLKTRKQIKVGLNVKNLEGNTLESHLSMSVRDLSAFPEQMEVGNIKSWLLLNSDLRGEIKNPGYFINEKSVNKRRYLMDLVMLTHGWRRFTWKDLLFKEKNNKFDVEKGIFINGKTQNLKAPYNIVPSVTRLTFLTSYEQEPNQPSEKGTFSFGPYVIFDTIPILVESRLTNDFISTDIENRKLSIVLDRPVTSPSVKISNEENFNNNNEAFFKITKYMNKIKSDYEKQRELLDEVIINAKKEAEASKRAKQMRERAEYGEPTHRLDLESRPVYGVQTAYDLISRMPGVAAFGGGITLRGANPRITIDNLPVDAEFMKTVNSDDVSFIDILTGAAASMFSGAGGGIIAVYTKNEYGYNITKRKPGIINFTAKGFYNAREFFAPDHINGVEELMKADVRTTLHWEPEIKITKEGNAEVSFFTSDSKGEYLIEVEGISNTGIPLYQTSKFVVE